MDAKDYIALHVTYSPTQIVATPDAGLNYSFLSFISKEKFETFVFLQRLKLLV